MPSGPRGDGAQRGNNCYPGGVATPAESVKLDEDVHAELRKLAERLGRTLDSLANSALREYIVYESQVGASVERGIRDIEAGRTRSTDEVRALLEERRRGRSGG